MSLRRIRLFGVPLDRLTTAGASSAIEGMLMGEARSGAVFAVNPEKVVRSQGDAELLDCLDRAALLIPDGIGVVVAARVLGLGSMERVPGSELMPEICKTAARLGKRVFLFGASPEVNKKAVRELKLRFPKLEIVGARHGFPGPSGRDNVEEEIRRVAPDVVFVALGSPAQEKWITARVALCPDVRIWQGVGGTFDVIAGSVRRAPPGWRRIHLEWLYRLLANPSRALRQVSLVKFTVMVLKSKLSASGH